MTGTQFRKAIAELDLNHEQAAAFLDVSLRTISGYANDTAAVPTTTAKLLRLMIALDLEPENVK